ncbi:Ig-like domain-containing protein [Algoriphagus sp. D3-2-R+10]|uniref:Ig-like domain-containing protein n=1 Tax=Algoriphagus aurantiacus TaxID=3103948 RepID=UPI002B3CA935|nr:Ig-like domain-containing protein [Algoriphagus sp. D3-2-R+10]MEB2774540.1 Ig-like domain-containing protein [Algoriphagus sp. D3-2-R+10]
MKTESTKKRFWQTILVALSITIIFGSCQDTFDEMLGICPEVESTNPDDEAIGVQLNKVIAVTFNDEMNPSSITDGSFSLRVVNTAGETQSDVPGALTYDASNNTMSFLPDAPLDPNTTYTGRVEPIVKDLMGNALQTPYIWTFTTGAAPTVTATNPVNLSTGIALNKSITAKFSAEMDPLTINVSSFTIQTDTTSIEGEVSYLDSIATFIPSIDLLPETTYTGTISVEAVNADGIPLATEYTWTFNTGAAPTVVSTDPADKATNVSVNTGIKVVFSETMGLTTISGSTFTVKQGNTAIAGKVTYSGTSASFTPNTAFSPNLVYTGMISTGAKNTLGIALASNYVWTFTTAAAVVAPTVTSTDPTNNATNVAIDKTIKAVFSESMNPTTLTGATFTLKQGNTAVVGTVTYAGTTASFVPTNPLSAGLVYTGTITTGAKNASGTALASNHVWKFTTAAASVVAPTVTSTDPVNNATNVALNKTVKAVFSAAMNPATLTGATFTLKQGNAAVAGTVTYTGTTASFVPNNPLSPSLVYTATITTGAKNASGTALASNYVWTFTTAAANAPVAPTVTSTDPVNNATNVALNKTVKAVFSEAMNPATLTAATFTLKQGNTAVAGTVTYTGTTASFVPTNPLSVGLVYTGTITNGAKNASGTPLASNYVWTFTTAAAVMAPTVTSTDPVSNATNVALNKTIKAVFSEAMNPATITGATFTVKQGNTAVAGTVTYTGTTASFVPNNPLLAGLVYTGTITTGAKNSSGTALASNHVWTFTTAAAVVAPTVTSTDPVNTATNVALNKTVKAVFSKAMDPATITGTTFTLKQGNAAIAGTVTYAGTTASFVPNIPLMPGLVYTATITTGAKDSSGTALASNYVWTFTTPAAVAPKVLSTDPQNNASNIALDKVVKATFSEPMNPATISGTTFTLKQGANTINGSVTYSGTTASFTPNDPLSPNLTYTGTITTGAQNLAGTGLADDYVWTFKTLAQQSAYFVDLKTAGRFGIFAATGISNNAGFSVIRNLDVGITPGARSSVTGFPPATIVNGAIYAADDASPAGVAAMLIKAKSDLTEAYLFAEGATSPAPATVAGDQGGKTLAPGIYKSNSTLLIQAGDLTLDAQGDPNAVWIFQIASGFTTVGGAGGDIILSGGAQAKNIFWQVGSSATIGDNTKFKGNVLALTSITMNSNAEIVGRMLVINGAVVMTNTNTIVKP